MRYGPICRVALLFTMILTTSSRRPRCSIRLEWKSSQRPVTCARQVQDHLRCVVDDCDVEGCPLSGPAMGVEAEVIEGATPRIRSSAHRRRNLNRFSPNDRKIAQYGPASCRRCLSSASPRPRHRHDVGGIGPHREGNGLSESGEDVRVEGRSLHRKRAKQPLPPAIRRPGIDVRDDVSVLDARSKGHGIRQANSRDGGDRRRAVGWIEKTRTQRVRLPT